MTSFMLLGSLGTAEKRERGNGRILNCSTAGSAPCRRPFPCHQRKIRAPAFPTPSVWVKLGERRLPPRSHPSPQRLQFVQQQLARREGRLGDGVVHPAAGTTVHHEAG